MALWNRRTDRSAWILRLMILNREGIFFFFFKKSRSLGVVVLEEKLFTRMLQSDAIMMAKCRNSYYSAAVIATALKICHDTEHQK